jgi:hypothetical protein
LPDLPVIVIEGLATADLAAEIWERIAGRVRDEGTGLLVLGGPGTFALGGYRHSPLEALLPVLSEPAGLVDPAAVMFVVDRSGSMAGPGTGGNALDMARRAVLHTALSLTEADEVGLIGFDVTPAEQLALKRYADPRARLAAAWRHTAGGGTRLAPALSAAARPLAASASRRRYLILVTDGYAETDPLPASEARLAAAGIEVIAIAVGADAATGVIEHLAQATGGAVLRVDDTAELPRVMRRALEQRRPTRVLGDIIPEPVAPLPFALPATPLPAWSGYTLTRARPDASVLLRSATGDPLLATHFAGLGRVAALPAGFGDWAGGWPDWPGWPDFAGGLLAWLHGSPNARSYPHFDLDKGVARMVVDVEDPDGGWARGAPSDQAKLLDTSGNWTPLDLEHGAPGRFAADLPLTLPGIYRVIARIGGQRLDHGFVYGDNREYLPPPEGHTPFAGWRNLDMVRGRHEDLRLGRLLAPAMDRPLRPILIPAVIVLYLLLLAAEFGVLAAPVNLHLAPRRAARATRRPA